MENYMHPADQLIETLSRVYRRGLTTSSGGNLSLRGAQGEIWITPSGIDKGALTRADIMCVEPDGTVTGPHTPSVELPFHQKVYQSRPDIHAVLHAHPPTLVAYSLAGLLPKAGLLPGVDALCGAVAFARYAVPGSLELGDLIVEQFARGSDAVLMENHGICVGAATMEAAYAKFEALERLALAELLSHKLGPAHAAPDMPPVPALPARPRQDAPTAQECALRRDMAAFVRRAYRQGLFDAAQGIVAARLGEDAFLITPGDRDRLAIAEEDLALVRDGFAEHGRPPALEAALCRAIYAAHPQVAAIFTGAPPHAAAFAVTETALDPRTIPESYIQLRDMGQVSYALLHKPDKLASLICPRTPALLCGNYGILATGKTLANAFDRLEVAEATAQSILMAREVGEPRLISAAQIEQIDQAFGFY